MLHEALTDICKAEAAAWERIEAANARARESIAGAEAEGQDSIEKTLARAESEIAYLTRTAEKKVTESALELASKTANRQATIRARAERRLDSAAEYIYERIVKN